MSARKRKKVAGEADSAALLDALNDLTRRQVELAKEIGSLQDEYTRNLEAISALRAVMSKSVAGSLLLATKQILKEGLHREEPSRMEDRARQIGRQLGRALFSGGDGDESEVQLRRGSLPHVARTVLRAEGFPMHADSIVAGMNLAGHIVNRDSLVTALARLAAKQCVFYRVDGEPNKFGLVEWLPKRAPEQPPPPSSSEERK